MKTKLMERIYSATVNGESDILDQIESDIATAKKNGELHTEEYDMRLQNDGSVTIKDKVNNQVTRAIDTGNDIQLSPVDPVKDMNSDKDNKNYSRKGASMFLVDENGKLRAYGWIQSLMGMKKANPNWKILSNYDWNALNNGLKNIRQFTEATQKLFTRATRRWAVLDKSMKLVGIFDITNARGLVKLNPGYTMVKERDYNLSIQPKIKGI